MIRIQKPKTFTFEGFDGIDTRKYHTDPFGSSQVTNFRIGTDGSLIKREGSRALCQLPTPVRAVWSGKYQGAFKCFMLCGSTIYEVNTATGGYRTVASVESTDSHAEFFYYRNHLYLVDGQNIYCVGEQSATPSTGYVPLIAKDWPDNYIGEIYQPRNLLNNRGRLTYVISETATSVLRLDRFVSTVDNIFLNGEVLPKDRWTIGQSAPYLNVTGLKAGDRLTVYVTYPNTLEELSTLKTATRAFIFGGINTSRPFLFGFEDPSVMVSSVYVSTQELNESMAAYPDSDSLYFPAGRSFKVGDGRFPISALSRHYDRMLIFTEGGTWMADSTVSGTETFPIMNINSSVGVHTPHGVAVLGNTPYTVGKDGIFKWTSDTDELNECNAYCISDEISSMLPDQFYKSAHAFADTKRREILFYCPELVSTVWVYSEETKKWTVFDGLSADLFFEAEESVGILSGGLLAVFDKNKSTDYTGNGVSALFRSNLIDMGSTDMKHMSYVDMRASRGAVTFFVELEGAIHYTERVQFDNKGVHNYSKRRVSSGRFNYAYVTLIASGASEQSIQSISLSAR